MICQNCGVRMQIEWGNLSFHKDGIEIFLMETPYYVCPKCGDATLTSDVKELVKKTLEEKKKYPDSPPTLFIHVREILNRSDKVVGFS